jgi:hypothetical protein
MSDTGLTFSIELNRGPSIQTVTLEAALDAARAAERAGRRALRIRKGTAAVIEGALLRQLLEQ